VKIVISNPRGHKKDVRRTEGRIDFSSSKSKDRGATNKGEEKRLVSNRREKKGG